MESSFAVFGRVSYPGGSPVPSVRVKAWDQDLRVRQELGEAETDEKGQYEIKYTKDKYARAEKAAADLLLGVVDSRGNELFMTDFDDILFNAPSRAKFDITIPYKIRLVFIEFEQIMRSIKPLLDFSGLDDPAFLREDGKYRDISFLARETGILAAKLVNIGVAYKLASIFKKIPAEFFYAILDSRVLLQTSLNSAAGLPLLAIDLRTEPMPLLYDIVLLPAHTITTVIKDATAKNIVSPQILKSLPDYLSSLSGLKDEAQKFKDSKGASAVQTEVEGALRSGQAQMLADALSVDANGNLPDALLKLQNAFSESLDSRAKERLEGDPDLSTLSAEKPKRIIESTVRNFKVSHERDLLKIDPKPILEHLASADPHPDEAIAKSRAAMHLRALEKKFPTTAFMASLERDRRAFSNHRNELIDIFQRHPDMDLSTVRIEGLFRSDTPKASAADISAAKDTLATLQRLYKVSPKYNHVKALAQNGIRSASKIKSVGSAKLLGILKEEDPSVSEEDANVIFSRATNIAIAASLQAGNLVAMTGATRIAALRPAGLELAALGDEFPNLKSLFQIGDFCACTDCRTVHSAAAYVADTLHFLAECKVTDSDPIPGQPSKSARQILFDRRSDLGDMDLSCDNTNITLPYIDVVCELLEEAISPDPGILLSGSVAAGPISPELLSELIAAGLPFTANAKIYDHNPDNAQPHELTIRDKKAVAKLLPTSGNSYKIILLKQTYGPQEQVNAMPQYVNQAAYQKLEAAQFAFSLPFSLSHEECLAYFKQFDVSRADLMTALRTSSFGPSENVVAGEILGLNDFELELISNSKLDNQDAFWGTSPSGSAVSQIAVVENFVNKTGLSYTELQNLLSLSWINPFQRLFIKHEDNSCNLSKKSIAGLDNDALDRFHRFLRLQFKTLISTKMLDRLIRLKKIGNGVLNNTFILYLSQLLRIRRSLKLDWETLSYIFDVLSSDEGEQSAYNGIFLNVSANGLIEGAFTVANLIANENGANNPTPGFIPKKLADYQPYLALCLGVSLDEIHAIITQIGLNLILSLANVTAVYAFVQLARATRFKIADFTILVNLTKIEVLSSASALLKFLEALDTVRSSGLPVPEIHYYLRKANNPSISDLNDAAISGMLQVLSSKYDLAASQNQSPFNSRLSPELNEGPIVDMLSKSPSILPADVALFKAMFEGVEWNSTSQTAEMFIVSKLVDPDGTVRNAQRALAAAPPDKNEAERNNLLEAVATLLSKQFLQIAKGEILESTIKAGLKLSDDTASILLEYAKLTTPDILDDTALKDILRAALQEPLTPDRNDNHARALRLIHIMAKFITACGLPPDGVKWMLLNNAKMGWLRLDRLKYQGNVPDVSFDTWKKLQDILSLIRKYPAVENPVDPTAPISAYGLFDLVIASGTTVAKIVHYFSQLSGLNETIVADLCSHFGFSHNLPPGQTNFTDSDTYRRLDSAATLLRTLGINVTQGKQIIRPHLAAADAILIRQALKARYDDADWFGVLQPIQNGLRKKKRDALVNYILAANPLPVLFKTADDLYDYFLIDVQMGSCMDTSRIVQAHATIQLFVQRCLLGLERHAVASELVDPKWAQWKSSMANYRLWELNKKVFLYPHAYLDQGIRKDKSELLSKFETSLNQDQLTDSVITSAFATYLRELQDIEHLDVLACYYQADILAMHVFASTKGGDPPTYFHRMFNQERSWTPWKTINVDITGNNLMAFDRNRRLTLAWPIFTEESDPDQITQGPRIPSSNQIANTGQENEKVRKRRKIQLAVSELVDGTWTSKKISRDALYLPLAGSKPGYLSVDELDKSYPQNAFVFFSYGGTGLGQAIGAMVNGSWLGAFALTGCSGYPEVSSGQYNRPIAMFPNFRNTVFNSGRFMKLGPDKATDLGMRWIAHMSNWMHILDLANPKFAITYPLELNLVDFVVAALVFYFTRKNVYSALYDGGRRGLFYQFGTFMPFFYGDPNRTYTIIPGWYQIKEGHTSDGADGVQKTYSDIYTFVDKAYTMALKWLAVFQADPEKDVKKLLEQIQADKDYKKLIEEWESFLKLQFKFKFRNFYHPLVCMLRIAFNDRGIPGLMDRKLQTKQTDFDFKSYVPTDVVLPNYPVEDLDFDTDGAYASYNWELFFHSVYNVAQKLNQDQRFDQAQNWYHHIFNPLGAADDPAPQKYWVTKPFQLTTSKEYYDQLINTILGKIAADPSGYNLGNLKTAVDDWRRNPFDPWTVAKNRTVELQIATVLAYVKNLIDWGDSLFRQFTREAITQATQLYILAHKLLGPKPRVVAPAFETPIQSYNELESKMDITGNALLDLENLLPDLGDLPHGGAELPPLPYTSLYFCIAPDEDLLRYWGLVEDRLMKIRTCRNIDGVEAHLSLFSPPVDFGALSRALAGGMSVSAFLGALGAPLPNYRFQIMAAKASELASIASSLGNSLLQVIEKRDAEGLSRLQSFNRQSTLLALRKVKEDAVNEAQSAIDGLSLTRAISQVKYNWYSTQVYMSPWEIAAASLSGASLLASVAIRVGYAISGGLKLIPSFMAGGAGFGGSPTVNVTTGGQQAGNGAEMATKTLEAIASGLDKAAGMATVQAGYRRREEEWRREAEIASAELADLDGKIATAVLHKKGADDDLKAHDQEMMNTVAEDVYLHSKYTNLELFDWMIRQTSQTYFTVYKLAFDMAKKAERCYQLELGANDTFVSYGFDTLKKGLTAADMLQSSIYTMQSAYLDSNKREYELTKHVSMRLLDPGAYLDLKASGKCTFRIPEAIFDLDYPGHYMRRHKTVSITIPCITGPYTSVCCKLSLFSNRYRRNTDLLSSAPSTQNPYDEFPLGGDSRFMYNIGSIQSVATSTCQDDSGLFEVNFHDERYLPFEGTGVIAIWKLELPSVFPQFDLNTINDVIFHIRYTARDGGSALADAVREIQLAELNNMTNAAKKHGLFQAYALPQMYATAWNQLRTGPDHKALLKLGVKSLPFFSQSHGPTIDQLEIYAALDQDVVGGGSPPAQLMMAVNGQQATTLRPDGNGIKGRYRGTYSGPMVVLGTEFTFQLVGMSDELIGKLKDVVLLTHYVLTT